MVQQRRAEPPHRGPPLPRTDDEASARRLAAVLRWRARLVLRAVPPATARAIRFLPATLQTSFPYPGLRDEPPGIHGVQVGRGWAALAAGFGLPAPVATRRGRRVIDAILVTLGEDGVVGWAIPAQDASNDEIRRLDQRVERIRSVLGNYLDLAVLDGAVPGSVPRLAAFGALIAGRLPPSFWPGADGAEPLDAKAIGYLALDAPTPFTTLALALLAGGSAPAPVAGLRAATGDGVPALALADPELFCALWAGGAAGKATELLRLLELATANRTSRRFASKLGEPDGPRWRREPRNAARVVALGRALALAAVRAASRAPSACRPALAARLRREAIEPGVPSFLLPAVARGLRDAEIRTPEDLPPPVPEGRAFVVTDGAGKVLARGGSAEQARLRARALAARAVGWSVPPGGSAAIRALAQALAHPPPRRAIVVAVEPAEVPGPPFDPLNRGPDRRLGFGTSYAIVLRPGRRPTARRLVPERLVDRLVGEALAGSAVELAAAQGAAEPAASRLDRLLRQATAENDPRRPPAVEAGGRIYLLGARPRRFSLGRFAARPLACAPDPEAPDLGVGGRLAGSGAIPKDRLECRVTRAGSDRVALLYVDERDHVLREEIPLSALERHLRDTQALLREPPKPVALALRVGPGFDGVAGLGKPVDIEVEVEVTGELPFGLAVRIRGERFGAGAPLGWRAAALAVLAGRPPGATGRVRVTAVTVGVAGRPAGGLLRLYARSLAVRRIEAHVRTQLRLKGRAGRDESIGNAEIGEPPATR
jgi:hypothetical protein